MAHKKSIKLALDNMGKEMDAELFSVAQDLFTSYQKQYPGQELGFFKFLFGGLTIVYDANIVRSILVRELKTGASSDLLNVAKSGFITPVAPMILDEEIAKYAKQIGEEAGVDGMTSLKYYLTNVRPYFRLVDPVDSKILKKVQATVRDPKDKMYIALHFERSTAGVATFDKDIVEYPEKVYCYSIKDLAQFNIEFRKHYVVMMINVFSIGAFITLASTILRFLWANKKRIFYGILVTGG